MPDYEWPQSGQRRHIGERISRLDGPAKVTGTAKYSYDVNRPGMLFAKILRNRNAHCRITKLDVSPARNMPGVKAVRVVQDVGTELQWALDEIVVVAATSEEIAEDALRAIQIEYEILPHFVTEENLEAAPETKPAEEAVEGDPDAAFSVADAKSDGYYGIAVISHCCLEPHGQVCEWESDQNLTAWCSTQAVSGLPGQFAEGLEIPAANVRVVTPYMGGGFGSKFSVDRWGLDCARLAKEAKAPVKLMLERDAELTVAGDRPSSYAQIQMAATRDGTITAWSSKSWGSGGLGGSNSPPLPYVFKFPNQRHQHISIPTHVAGSRAWRAPNHPQACYLTMSALEDLAAELKMDPLDFFQKNIAMTGVRADTYAEELKIAADLIGWKQSWHPRGQSGSGPVKRGLGLALHTWGGRAHNSNCDVLIHPDGIAEVRMGTQDLGTGTRTVIAMVLAETLGLPLESVKVNMGDSVYPASGASGGSTTVGGVTSSTRRASVHALDQLFAKLAPALETTPEQLEAVNSRIQVKGDSSKGLSWKEATGRLGVNPITATGQQPGPGKLNDSGVGGVQMADVSVDVETGVVRINKMVAVQDCGLIVNMKLAESQVFGALIMGVAYALVEEKIMDPVTGIMLNATDLEAYRLATIGDIGELVVHMMTGPGYDERGVIGLGEPPVISPGAAIGNAVANAIGVRVSNMPLTPDRVLTALEKGGVA
ncbi:MAG: xanthine dehydrogenase family protein molybdopterin-binding subunit [Acidobacteriota bacterium]